MVEREIFIGWNRGIYFWKWIKNKPAIQAGFNVGQKNLMGICFEILDSGFLVKFWLNFI